MEFQKIIRNYFEKLHSNKFENLKEINRFLDAYDYPKVNQEDIIIIIKFIHKLKNIIK
jgi:hypothetical protein